MASSVSIDVDLEQNKTDDLEFQDIPHDTRSPVETNDKNQGRGQTHTFTNFPHSAADSDDEESDQAELLKEKKSASFWTFEYYQQFFNVETNQVAGRILGSMLPRPGRSYLESHIRPNPDLYGPFWICTTLVFTTAIAGNLANYIQAAGKDYHWTYDFHKVTWAATAIFSYWWVIPFALFGLLWWRGNPARYTFLEIICIYGYSLAIYIPISLLWVIQVGWLQWLLVVLGAVLSGSVLLLTFWPAVKDDTKQVAGIVMALVFIFHAALAMGFMLYFFHVPATGMAMTTIAPQNTTLINNPSHAVPTSRSLLLKGDSQPLQQKPESNFLLQQGDKANEGGGKPGAVPGGQDKGEGQTGGNLLDQGSQQRLQKSLDSQPSSSQSGGETGDSNGQDSSTVQGGTLLNNDGGQQGQGDVPVKSILDSFRRMSQQRVR